MKNDSSISSQKISDISKVSKGAGLNLFGKIINKTTLFLYTIFITYVLSPSDVGIYFFSLTIITFLTVLGNLGLSDGVQRYIAIYKNSNEYSKIKGIILTSLLISLSISSFIVSFLYIFNFFFCNQFFPNNQYLKFIILLSIAIPFENGMMILLAATRALKIMKYTVLTENILWVVLRLFIALLLILVFNYKLTGIIYAYVGSCIICFLFSLYFACNLFPLLNKRIKPVYESRELIRFSVPMVFSALSHKINRQVDILMLGLFATASAVGTYGLAVRLIVLAEVFFNAFQPIFKPFISDFHSTGQIERLSSIFRMITRWSITLSLPIFLLLICFPDNFLSIYGNDYSSGAVSLAILALAHIFSSSSMLASLMIFMSGRSDISFKNNLIVLVLNIALNYLLIPQYGINGAAIATGCALGSISIIRFTQLYLIMKIQPFSNDLWKPITASCCAIGTIYFLSNYFDLKLMGYQLFLLAIYFISYFIILYFFKFNKEDLILKKKIISKFKQLNH